MQLGHCLGMDPAFDEMARQVASRWMVDVRALTVRTLLHLPRVANHAGLLRTQQIMDELVRAAKQLRADTGAAADLMAHASHELRDLRFGRVEPAQAERIFSALHYLRSARPDSTTFALLDPVYGRPVTLCSVSPMEWRRVGRQITRQFAVSSGRIRDVSRVYSSDVAPPNAISFLLARVKSALREADNNVDLLLTVVDQNLGFTGSSYRAANWQHWMSVRPRPYLYEDGQYVSPRQLRERFGTAKLLEIEAHHSDRRFEWSRVSLLDSLIFCRRLRGDTETVQLADRRRLRR